MCCFRNIYFHCVPYLHRKIYTFCIKPFPCRVSLSSCWGDFCIPKTVLPSKCTNMPNRFSLLLLNVVCIWPHVDPWPHNFYPFLINKGIFGSSRESKPRAIHYSHCELDIIFSCRWIKVLCRLLIALCSICEFHLISPFVLLGLYLHPWCHTLKIFYSAYFVYRVGICRRYGSSICVKEEIFYLNREWGKGHFHIPPFLGIVGDKKWSPFLDLGIRSPIFLHPKTASFSNYQNDHNTPSALD